MRPRYALDWPAGVSNRKRQRNRRTTQVIAWIVFGVTLAAFIAAVAADASSSGGLHERTKLYRGKNGFFSLWRYLLVMGAWVGIGVVFALLSSPWPPAASFVMGAVMRFRVAAHNRKIQKGYQSPLSSL
jgi:hypothetical protein